MTNRNDIIEMWKAACLEDPTFDEPLEEWLDQWEWQQEAIDKVNAAWGVQDSDIPPAWFDPTLCGESWDGE
jgi:hypothetical protein